MTVRKIASGNVNTTLDKFVGEDGILFYDHNTGELRISDGHTPGGRPLDLTNEITRGTLVQSDLPPYPYSTSTLWYDTVGGRTYVYFEGTWVDASPEATSTGTAIPQEISYFVNDIGYLTTSSIRSYMPTVWELTSATSTVSLNAYGALTFSGGAVIQDYNNSVSFDTNQGTGASLQISAGDAGFYGSVGGDLNLLAGGGGNTGTRGSAYILANSILLENDQYSWKFTPNGQFNLGRAQDQAGTFTDVAIQIDSDTDSYAQVVFQNHNSGTNASTDIVLMNSDGDDFTNIIDIGINSNNYNFSEYSIQSPGSGYLFTNGGDLTIGTQTHGKAIIFHAGGTTGTNSVGRFDQYGMSFNRQVIVSDAKAGPLVFSNQNISSSTNASAVYQAENDNGGYIQIGILGTNNVGPGGDWASSDSFITANGSGQSLHIGGQQDLRLYASRTDSNIQDPALWINSMDQTAVFDGNILPQETVTYDIGSTSSQWNNLYINGIRFADSSTQTTAWNTTTALVWPGQIVGGVGSGSSGPVFQLTSSTAQVTLRSDGNLILPGNLIADNLTLRGAPYTITITDTGGVWGGAPGTYTRLSGITPPKWAPANYNPGSDSYITYDGGWQLNNPNFGHPVYVNTGGLFNPSATWDPDTQFGLGSGNPAGAYTYNNLTFGVDGKLTVPGNVSVNGGRLSLSSYGNAYIESVDYGINTSTSALNIFSGTYQNINLRAGFGTEAHWKFGINGTLTFPSGAGFANGDSGQLKTNDGTTLSLDFRDSSGRGFYTNSDGFSLRGNGSNTWKFGTTGSLTFPDATVQTTAFTGTVAYSNITGAPAVVNKTSGSWILATGANTVSITVAPGGNYQMWVNGNIPNGIVEWNATVNVSNTNVPAIGSQYAWYYAAGNALVLTAIPNQIVGTAGVISSSTSYAGTTSNVFSFGITNNSASTQTVYWGYTTL